MTLVLDRVSKRVGEETHICDVSLTFERGSLNVLLGPTLSGKTSLMRLMAGLDVPTQGRVLVDGVDVTGMSVRKRSVAMVYQQFINYPTLSVYENIASPLRVAKVPATELDRRVREAAHLLKLDALLDRKPLELSGGQQQRTALARAIVKHADLLLLDEPLANLDYKLREELREELPRLFAETGAILVYATTEPSEALLLGGNTATLDQGRVVQFGPTIEVYRRPVSLVSAQRFSDPPMNTAPVHKSGAWFRSVDGLTLPALGEAAGLPDGDYTIGFRTNHLYLNRPAQDAVALTAIVAITEITGSESFVHVDFGSSRWVALAHGVHELDIGQPVELFLDPHRIFVFAPDGSLAAAAAIRQAA
ncbi:carbohydrate ABC transporter ATP-binding protein (CUT1 family) [Tepidamorphus gemmatus]|uniref:Carbohydrate ABC transporter ATP-binding protein (CUT1 family) n=1 Tax=Tepidamorphus gemmatus TaxID=747076 RepID=A0A4R3ME07_9HYPH|nr:ABC transporter ATP-binding protein [Tepidamorphus gemmatus]TCT11721.1 carbohydrate ABC transporter ATP-binding protein (CUT1 family) [Tepidamorphus gemmatus]